MLIKNLSKKLLINFQNSVLQIFNFFHLLLKRKTPYRLFTIGVTEIAGNINTLKKIFAKDAFTVCLDQNPFYNYSYDYSLHVQNKRLKTLFRFFYGPYLLSKLVNQSDIFIYFWHTGFCFQRELDYQFLKKKGKKIICIFVGDDIRSRVLALDYFRQRGLDSFIHYDHPEIMLSQPYDDYKKKVASLADQYADIIISHPVDQISYLKSKQYFFLHLMKDTNFYYNPDKFKKEKVKIVHAPSNSTLKGTPLVRAAIKKLQEEGYQFDYQECIGVDNQTVLEALKSAHIVLNQFYTVLTGLFGLEAMAHTTAVLMSADYDLFEPGAEKAWLQTKYWQVYDHLKYLLDYPEKIKELALNGYHYLYNHYREECVRKRMLDLFEEKQVISSQCKVEILSHYSSEQ